MNLRSKIKITMIAGLSLALIACGDMAANNHNSTMNVNRASTPAATPTIDRTNSNISREEYDKHRAEYEKDKGTSTIGQGLNDSWLWFKTRAAFATAEIRESTINVDVENDVITLKGSVASAAEKSKAETVAKGIEGQKGVKNQLQVRPKDSITNQMVNGNSAAKTDPKMDSDSKKK